MIEPSEDEVFLRIQKQENEFSVRKFLAIIFNTLHQRDQSGTKGYLIDIVSHHGSEKKIIKPVIATIDLVAQREGMRAALRLTKSLLTLPRADNPILGFPTGTRKPTVIINYAAGETLRNELAEIKEKLENNILKQNKTRNLQELSPTAFVKRLNSLRLG